MSGEIGAAVLAGAESGAVCGGEAPIYAGEHATLGVRRCGAERFLRERAQRIV